MNVDALFCHPIIEESCEIDLQAPVDVAAATNSSWEQAKDGQPTWAILQQSDSQLSEIVKYFKKEFFCQTRREHKN